MGVTRSLLVIFAVRPPGILRRSDGGISGESPFASGLVEGVDVSSAISSSHLGSRRTFSGIGSTPSGRGYASRRYCRSLADQGRNEPSILDKSDTLYGYDEIDLPLWMLFIRFTTVTYDLGSELNETIIEFTMSPVVFGIRCVSQAKGGKLHLMQTSWA